MGTSSHSLRRRDWILRGLLGGLAAMGPLVIWLATPDSHWLTAWILASSLTLAAVAWGFPRHQPRAQIDLSAPLDLAERSRQSEERFRSLLRLSSDWYWEQDQELRYKEISLLPPNGEDAVDSPRTRLLRQLFIGKRRWQMPVSGVSDAQWHAHRAALEQRQTFRDFECSISLPGEEEAAHVSISGEPMFDAEGTFQGYRGVGRNITREKKLRIELHKLGQVIEQAPITIFITDIEGKIEYANRHFYTTTGYTAEEALGHNSCAFRPGHNPSEIYGQLWSTVTAGQRWSGQLQNRRKNGELYWEQVHIYPLRSDDDQLTHFITVKEDITEHYKSAASVKQRAALLHRARLASMGEMAAAMAHELNQPLAAISNFSGVLAHQLEAATLDRDLLKEVVANIGQQSLRAGDIIWRIREFSRKQEVCSERVDINTLIGEVVRLVDIAERFSGIAYEFELDESLPEVTIDRVQIEQVLLNLIRNGIEAMEEVTQDKWLRLVTRRMEGFVQVSVSDHGCGLLKPMASKLYNPFYTTKTEGMGMGLPISQGIIEAHGGRLWSAPNRSGRGTSFHFTLPLDEPTAKDSTHDAA